MNGLGSGVTGRIGGTAYNFEVADCAGDFYTHCNHGAYGGIIVDTLFGYCLPTTVNSIPMQVACAGGYEN